MLLRIMTMIVVLVWPSCEWEATEPLDTDQTTWRSAHLWSERNSYRVDWCRRFRLAARRRRRSLRQPFSAESLELPSHLRQPAPQQTPAAPHDDEADFTECCPAVEERTSPRAGTRPDGSLAILYTDDTFQQMFFERSCAEGADGERPTGERHSRRRLRCEQEYSHSYAIYTINGSKVLDYIRVRSGCKCHFKQKSRRKKKKRRNRRKSAETHRKETKWRGHASDGDLDA